MTRRFPLVLGFVLLLAGGGAGAQETGAAASEPAKVIRRPTPADVDRLYPLAGVRAGMGGRALVTCRIGLDKRLYDCAASEEQPAGYGFGDAAIAVARLMVVEPPTVNGRPIADTTLKVPITFKMAAQVELSEAPLNEAPAERAASRASPQVASSVIGAACMAFAGLVLLGFAGVMLWPVPQPKLR